MAILTLRERVIKLAFEVSDDILLQTIEEWEATLEILYDKELLEDIRQGEKEISNGQFDKLDAVAGQLFGKK